MKRFIQSIEKSIETENWYAAISLALTLPDICGWLEDPKMKSQERYKAWFDKYMLPKYLSPSHGKDFTFLSGSDCYALRCALLHEGTDDVLRQKAQDAISRFAFSTTGSHKCRFETVLLLNVQEFCREICESVKDWANEVKGNNDIQNRMKEILLVRTEGFSIAPGIFVQ